MASRVQNDDSEVSFQEKQSIQMNNSVVGHLGVDRTYKALKLRGHNWMGMKEDLKNYTSECIICQKIKWADGDLDLVDHHLKSVTPLQELSIDTLGHLTEDDFGVRFIILVDNFSKFFGLYTKNTSTLEGFVKAFLFWVGIIGVPKVLRSDGGSQFSSDMAERLKYLLKYQHIITVPYHPQGNSIAERWMKETCVTIYL